MAIIQPVHHAFTQNNPPHHIFPGNHWYPGLHHPRPVFPRRTNRVHSHPTGQYQLFCTPVGLRMEQWGGDAQRIQYPSEFGRWWVYAAVQPGGSLGPVMVNSQRCGTIGNRTDLSIQPERNVSTTG